LLTSSQGLRIALEIVENGSYTDVVEGVVGSELKRLVVSGKGFFVALEERKEIAVVFTISTWSGIVLNSLFKGSQRLVVRWRLRKANPLSP